MSQACAAFRLPLSQQQHMRLVDRGRVLEVGTFRTLLGVGVGAGSELMLTSETITSIGDHRSNYSFHEHFVKPCDYSPHDRRAVNWTCDGCGKNGDPNIGLDSLPFSLPPLQRFRCTMGCDFAVIVGTRIVLQEADVHFWNKLNIFNTEATFQPPMGCLKAVAELNVAYMLATAATFQPPIGWLKVVA